MTNKITEKEMATAYPEVCRRTADLQSEYDCAKDCIQRLKGERDSLKEYNSNLELEIMKYKARLYDLTSGEWM